MRLLGWRIVSRDELERMKTSSLNLCRVADGWRETAFEWRKELQAERDDYRDKYLDMWRQRDNAVREQEDGR